MTYRRFATGVALAAVALLGIAGCANANSHGEVPVASPAPPVSAPGKDTGGALVKGSDLVEFTISMPAPKGAPPDGTWSDVTPAEDGHVRVFYMDKNGKGYASVELLDCRLPAVQAAKGTSDQAGYPGCFKKPTRSLKGYPLILPDDPNFAYRSLVVNRVTVSVGVAQGFDATFKAADVEEFIGTLDLDTLAKL